MSTTCRTVTADTAAALAAAIAVPALTGAPSDGPRRGGSDGTLALSRPGPGASPAPLTDRLLDSDRLPGHLDRLYRAAWALCGSPHEAEDLVQETIARVLARPRRLRGAEELAYLLGALRNVYLTSLRSASRRPRGVELRADESATMRSAWPEPDEALEHAELLEAIDALPREFREALVAVDIVGLSYGEAAHMLGTREATIGTRLFRARQRVAGILGRETAATAAGKE